MEKKSRKSASKWELASERTLIAILSDKMGELRESRRNSHILAEMVAELKKQGFSYSVEEYRKEKQKVGTTGGSPSEWDLYNEMQTLLAPFKSYHCENLVQDSINDVNSIIEMSPLPSSSPSSSAAFVASALPSPSAFENSPLPSTSISPPSRLPSSSKTKIKKKDSLCNTLKKVETNIEKIQDEMNKTSQNTR